MIRVQGFGFRVVCIHENVHIHIGVWGPPLKGLWGVFRGI